MQDYRKIRDSIARDVDACGLGLVASPGKAATTFVLEKALRALSALDHRGAVAADGVSGDGCGILTEIPHELLRTMFDLPEPGRYALATVFTYGDESQALRSIFDCCNKAGDKNLVSKFRFVPVVKSLLGPVAAECAPRIFQILAWHEDESEFNAKELHQLRIFWQNILQQYHRQNFVTSVSTSAVVYKAMVRPAILREFFPDLQRIYFKTRYAIVHTRFSTNTLPNWNLIQPFSRIAHNGEFNTLKGNLSWFMADLADAR